MKSFKKAGKNQATSGMTNSSLNKSETLPVISVTGTPQDPHCCWSSIIWGIVPHTSDTLSATRSLQFSMTQNAAKECNKILYKTRRGRTTGALEAYTAFTLCNVTVISEVNNSNVHT